MEHTIRESGQDAQDPSWSARIKRGDIAAFEQLYRSTYPALLGFARSYVKDDAVAQDVVQDAFTSMWRRRSKLDTEGSIKAYLYKVVRNKALNAIRNDSLRSVRQSEYADEATDVVDPVDTVDATQLRGKLNAWIEALPERQREALMLSRFDGLSHSEIADVMGVSARTVNNHLVSALRFLRNKVTAFEPSLLET